VQWLHLQLQIKKQVRSHVMADVQQQQQHS
jgi:hypothetical protein